MAQAPGPTVSLHQLARYLVATPLGRRRIVERQKRPFGLSDMWYEFADNTICRFLVEGATNIDLLTETADDLYREGPDHETEAVRLANNAEALDAFHDALEQFDTDDVQIDQSDREKMPPLLIAGVDVAVAPELILRSQSRGRPTVGAVKLYFSKDARLDDRAAGYMTALVQDYVERVIRAGDETVAPRLVRVFDIFAGRVHEAPSGTQRRLREIEAACEEIALWWPVV
jgi:hypothetical protein